jgi:hypothetical protein
MTDQRGAGGLRGWLGFAACGHAQGEQANQEVSANQGHILSEKNTPAGAAVRQTALARHGVHRSHLDQGPEIRKKGSRIALSQVLKSKPGHSKLLAA